MKYGKQYALKRKLDRQTAEAEEQARIDDMVALVTKCEVLNMDNGYAYLYLLHKGYDINMRLTMVADKEMDTLDPRIEIIYKHKVVTPKGLKEPKKYLKIGGKKMTHKRMIEVCRNDMYTPSPISIAEHALYYGEEEGLKKCIPAIISFMDAMRGYDAEGHAVHRLVARSDTELTYLTAKSLLRCTDMRDATVGGLTPQFTPDGHLATLW